MFLWNTSYLGIKFYSRGIQGMWWLVAALRYKQEGYGFDSQWGNWDFSLT